MNTRSISFLFVLLNFLVSCASTRSAESSDVVPAPQMAQSLERELAKIISPSQCRILGCVNSMISDPHYFVCEGEFSFMTSPAAHRYFQKAAGNMIGVDKNTRFEFTANERVGSRMLGAFFSGLVGGLVAAMFGRG